MSTKVRTLIVAALVGLFGLGWAGAAMAQIADMPGGGTANDAVGGGLEAPAVGELGDTSHGPCVETLLDLPAIGACEDAEGRVVMDLPALKLVGPRDKGPEHPVPHAPTRLPVTGVNAGDLAALGFAALTGGGVIIRRLRLAVAR